MGNRFRGKLFNRFASMISLEGSLWWIIVGGLSSSAGRDGDQGIRKAIWGDAGNRGHLARD
jgi:hypothetical protein